MKEPERIYNIEGLKNQLGVSRGRVNQLLQAKRILPDYIDDAGMRYWSQKSIDRYKELLKIPASRGAPRQWES